MAKYDFKVFKSSVNDTRINLALEEYFLNSVKENEYILFFWQSENSVVIGRNQNPYQECNLKRVEEDKVQMVRRLSGGGAVYHDLGNLNFSFIAKEEHYDIKMNFDIILKALKRLNIVGVFNGRNDLIVHGRKFSGNAFITEEDCRLHHGTLLINSNVLKISEYLTVSHKKLETKGFDSIQSRVINLSEINPEISVDKIIQAVCDEIEAEVAVDTLSYHKDCEKFIGKYRSHTWNFGDCSPFEISGEIKFQWGILSIGVDIEEGIAKRVNISTDALKTEGFKELEKALTGIIVKRTAWGNILELSKFASIPKADIAYAFDQLIFN